MRYLAILALLTSASLTSAQTVSLPFQKFTLGNGLTVIVHEDHKAPIVAVNIWYHVGSKNEKPGKTGFAHLFEHLMFGGSENLKGRYIEGMEKIGATELNGTTNEDRTNYFENVSTGALDFALFAESDRMGHFYNTINKEVLDLQRGVVQNEKRQGENSPYAVAYDMIQRETYPAGHPYSHTVIGSMEDLNAASLDDVKEWFKTYYGPSNAVLVLAGDIDLETAKAKVTKYFGDIPAGPPIAHPKAAIAKMTGERRSTVEDRVPAARMYKVWNTPPFGSPESAYLRLVGSVLSSGRSSRLYKRLVYDEQIATAVQAGNQPAEIGSQFAITVTAKPGGGLEKIEADVREELARFIKDGPTADELERAKTQYLAQFIRGAERVGGFGGKSDILAQYQTYVGDAGAYQDTLKRVQSATPGDLKDAAMTWLSDGVYTLEVTPYPQLKAEAKGVDRTKTPEIGAAATLKLPKTQKATLSNGLNIVLAERHEIPVVQFWLGIDAGYASDKFATPGTARLAATLMTSGTAKRNALAISDEQQALGAIVNVNSSLDSTTVYLSALKTKLDASLDLYADIVLNPSFPQADFVRQQRLQLAGIEQEKVNPGSMAFRVLPPLLFGAGHAYGASFTGSGVASAVSKLTRDDVVKFHQQWFKPNHATLIITGDTTLAEIQPKLERLFAGWKPGTTPKKVIASVPRPARPAVYLIDKPGAPQSLLFAATLATPALATQEPAIHTMNEMFGGTFGSRLNMNLREDKHWSYGANSAMPDTVGQRPYFAVAGVQTDKTKESLVEMQKEIVGMTGARPISDEELGKTVTQQVRELPGSYETAMAVGSSIQRLIKLGFPEDYYDTLPGKLKSLRVADINDAAKSLLDPQHIIWVVVGDRAKVEQGIRELNIGEIKILDADGNVQQ